MAKKVERKLYKKTEKNNFLFVLLLLVITSAIFIFSGIVSKSSLSTNSKATINCRNYTKRNCPVNNGCQLLGDRCVVNPSFGSTSQSIRTACYKNSVIQVMYYGKTKGVDYTAARIATGKLLNSSRILTGGLLPPKINNNCQVEFRTCYGKVEPDTTCITFIPSNLTLKKCSQVCIDGGGKWCKVYLGNNGIPNGCINKDYSSLYNNIPEDYKNSNNLWNCANSSNLDAPYNYYTYGCCQLGCIESEAHP